MLASLKKLYGWIKGRYTTKKKLRELARRRGKSIAELLDAYVSVGFIVDRYSTPSFSLLVQNGEGADDVIIDAEQLQLLLGKRVDAPSPADQETLSAPERDDSRPTRPPE